MAQARAATVAAFTESTRDLDFRAPFAVPPTPWRDIMSAATPHGYNEFAPGPIAAWFGRFDGIAVCAAREGSVAAYVVGPRATLERMLEEIERARSSGTESPLTTIDEAGMVEGTLRLWWD